MWTRTFIAIVVLVFFLQLGGCNRSDSKLTFSAHSKPPIPKSAKLVQSGGQYAGFDASYGFVFEVSDDVLQKQLVKEWSLEPAEKAGGGFFKFAMYGWWPTDDEFAKMEPSFAFEDMQNEEYWLVWYDQSNGKLYAEHGRW